MYVLINRHTYAYGIWYGIGVCIGVPAKRGNSEHIGHTAKKKQKTHACVPVYKSCASCKLATKSDLRGSTRHYPARTRSSSRNLTSASDRPHRHCVRTFTLQLKKYKEVLAMAFFFPYLFFLRDNSELNRAVCVCLR